MPQAKAAGAAAGPKPAALQPIDRGTLWDRAYAALREALLTGRYEPGHRILLRDIAAELGISLTPVRDAVNHLIAERILRRGTGGQGGGAVVPEVDAGQLRQLLIMRAELESRAAHEAAAHVTPADLETLRGLLADMKRLIDADGHQGYLDVHRRFHFHIYAMSGMDILEDAIETLWLRCGPVLNLVLPEYVPYLKRMDYHAEAVAALARGDADGAAHAIRCDILEAGRYIQALLDRAQA
ncbi:GntR family transcriptional regulator [Bordetella genomosp. 9]|uniref:GntR family transcriptional regulator n=1 Tax=Bordetella genomosp. 9 TaxID=1416803 RepID=A0A1W6Z6B9_9BORD|nr:GntR family transcriptional regulator [Bordetella genomosp. 9]ARP88649.1 GntR family transcriptional regulator [Bordetella genomosp. 9]ARP90584.1 GntR family transcriptional regulator [Bordetella genomosp. 9]